MVKELERKQRIKQAIYSWPSLAVFLIITILLAKGAYGILSIERQSASKVSKLEIESRALAQRKEDLRDEIERLGTEAGMFEEIREKFSVARDGEYVAIIVDDKVEASSTRSWAESWYGKLSDAIIFWK